MNSNYINCGLDVTGVYATKWLNTLEITGEPNDQARAVSLTDFILEGGVYTDFRQCYDRRMLTDSCGVYCYLSADKKTAAVSLPLTYDHLDLTGGAVIGYDTREMGGEPYANFAVVLGLPDGRLTLLPRVDTDGRRIGGDIGSIDLARDIQAANSVAHGVPFNPGSGGYKDGQFDEFLATVKDITKRVAAFAIDPTH